MEKEKTNEKSQGLSKVLGPMHIWALGVGIVLVGEFMGWNFTVAKGGSIGSVIALWTVAMLYVMIVDDEIRRWVLSCRRQADSIQWRNICLDL